MGGASAQLVSYGVADQYLTAQPEITWFKQTYRRHTPWAGEDILQSINGQADFGKKATVTIARTGDLVHTMWLTITLPHLYSFDVSPAPSEGNPVDATASLHQNASTRDWYAASNLSGTPKVVWWNGDYYVNTLNVATATSAADVSPASKAVTWPYLLNAGGGTWAVPTTRLRWCDNVARALLTSVELEIGGTRIDRHVPEFLDAWSELTEAEEKRAGFHELIGKYDDYEGTYSLDMCAQRTYYVPMAFFFCRHVGQALPLISITYNDVKVNMEFRPYLECVRAAVPVTALTARGGSAATPSFLDARFYASYVYLDTDERRRFATVPHEYLVETLQYGGDFSVLAAPGDIGLTRKFNLSFNHPVIELIWVYLPLQHYTVDAVNGNRWFDFGLPGGIREDAFTSSKLVFNGHDRFSERPGQFFRLVQPYQHHTRCPRKYVYCYSFALNPESHQPSGTANFSRLDVATLQCTMHPAVTNGKVKVFARSWNVIRIANGLAGLAFAGS